MCERCNICETYVQQQKKSHKFQIKLHGKAHNEMRFIHCDNTRIVKALSQRQVYNSVFSLNQWIFLKWLQWENLLLFKIELEIISKARGKMTFF